jgi:hypothetical protein
MEARGEIPVQPGPGMGMGLSPFTGQASSPGEQTLPLPGLPQAGIGGLGGLSPAPTPQPRGMVIVDADTGEELGTLDYDSASARAAARVGTVFDPLIANQRNGNEQRAAAIAKDTALRMLGQPGITVEEAIKEGHRRYDQEMGNETAKSVARGGKDLEDQTYGGVSYEKGGRTPEQVRTSKSVADYVHMRIIQKAQNLYSTKELVNASAAASSIAAKMTDSNSVSQRGGIRDVIVMTEGKRGTDKDLNYALSGAGKLAQLHMELKSWTDGGDVPQQLKSKFQAYAHLLTALTKKQQAKAMRYAEELVYDDPGLYDFGLSPEDKAYWARQAKRGVAGQAIGLSPRGKAEKEKGEAAVAEEEGGDADTEAESLGQELRNAR